MPRELVSVSPARRTAMFCTTRPVFSMRGKGASPQSGRSDPGYHCEKDTGFAHIVTVKPPVPLMKHSLASPSTVAYIMTQKYVDGLPLARQEKMWAREGISLSRATMANWVIQCSQSWRKPLYKHMKQELLTHSVIHADETVVQVLKENGKPATSESRMWLYASAALIRHQVRLFEYQPHRSGKRPVAFLNGFTGALVTDGYQGYNLLTKVTHCGCWSHARRKWREAMPEGATAKTSKAAVGFQYCNKLFAQERKCAAYKPKYRQEYRQNRELPLLEEYYAWLNTVHPEKGSKLEEAVRYSLNQSSSLRHFWTTEKCRFPTTWQKTPPVRLPSVERTGCSAIPQREPKPAPLCIPWRKVQRQTVLNLLPISSMCWWSCRISAKPILTKNWGLSCRGHHIFSRNSA